MGWRPLEQLGQDLRQGVRFTARSPVLSGMVILSLGLGIGANTAIFSVIDALMLKRLPVKEPDQLVRIINPGEDYGFSYPSFEKYRDFTEVFSGISAVCLLDRFNIREPGSTLDSNTAAIGLVSGTYFSTLGVDAVIGSTFTADDDRTPGGHPVTVISFGFWERRLGKASDVVGQTLTLNGTAYTILGVSPPGFSGDWVGRPADLWIPIAMQSQVMQERPGLLTNPGPPWLRILARLKPGVSKDRALAAVQAVYPLTFKDQNLSARQLEGAQHVRIELESAARGFSPQRRFLAQALTILLIVVGLVLLIACANIANLLLARGAARQKEIAVRMAIGASRLKIVRLLMTESLLLALLGGVLGLMLGIWGANALVKVAGSGLVSFHLALGLDSRILALTAALCLITGLLSGLAPAMRASSLSLSPALSERERDTGISGRKFRFGKAMVISQVSLSVLLLIGAGLFIRTLRNLKLQNLGFDQDHVLLIWTAPDQGGRRGASVASLFQITRERLSSIPGVISASPSTHGLLGGNYGPGPLVVVPGNTFECSGEATAAWNVVAPGFFDTVGMRLVRGRDFTEQDNESAPQVVIINETMARCFFKDEDPIGKRFGKGRDVGYPWEIVGVVKDAKDNALRETNRRLFYVPYRQDVSHLDAMCVAVRIADNRAGLVARISQELTGIDPNVPVLRISSVEEQMNESLVQERLIAQVSAFFAALAVLLACAGLYGVISYTTARKTREIGIRISLGSTPSDVVAMILKENLAMVLIGITIGVIAALVFGRLISAWLFGISPNDSFTFVCAALLMIVVATLAAFLPARRASRVDPMVALRYE